ncbi:hypothetical protein B0H63DRAFT_197445 [Podospora didyma]|uniref:NWD NACHT-NTPase N-terminal domain-containing protein n=1 Tax=Podospora didyma TaxID=330526 RepID=A0AAE0NGP6_9PEZI|nr:hypothetical protein B0H63DRAFT_197445 [Podospora didyma]
MDRSFRKRWANWREARREGARDGLKTHSSVASTATSATPSTASPTSPNGAASLALPIKQPLGILRPSAKLQAFSGRTFSTEVQRPEQGSADYRPVTPSGTTTGHVTPTPAFGDHDHAQRSNIDARATGHHQPAAVSQAPPSPPSIEPRAEPKAIESTEQPTSALSVTLKDPSQRQAHMRKLVEEGQAKVSTLSKITQGVGNAVQFVLSAKAMVDLAIQNIPQAALPWVGVCIGLQILLNPVQAIESNLVGIAHVISRMDWYCALTEHILSQNNIVVRKESFKSVQFRLENRIVELYKALLLY